MSRKPRTIAEVCALVGDVDVPGAMASGVTPTDEERLIVWRVRPVDAGPWLYGANLADLAGVVEDGAEGGNQYELEAVEMTKAQWENVSDDFPGW